MPMKKFFNACLVSLAVLMRCLSALSPVEVLVQQQAAEIQSLRADVDRLTTQLQLVRTRLERDERVVSFMVSLSGDQDLVRANVRLHFGTPDLNVGGGFDTNTDTFVAPVSGLYVFFLKIAAVAGEEHNYGIFSVIKEGSAIAETEAADSNNVDRSSVQVIVQLTSGQSVWVEKTAGTPHTVLAGNSGVFTTFGGFLLREGSYFSP